MEQETASNHAVHFALQVFYEMVFYFIFDHGSTSEGKKIAPVPVEASDFIFGKILEQSAHGCNLYYRDCKIA
jgi:hypothetical protein